MNSGLPPEMREMESPSDMRFGQPVQTPPTPRLTLRLLGPLTVHRGDQRLALPASRKVRALLAYLALAGRATARSHLCELLWDMPSDPRGELRWCLSKLRAVLDEPGRPRVVAVDDRVALDLADCSVDALEVLQAVQQGVAALPAARLQALAQRFGGGDLLEGFDLPRSPAFTGWLVAERRRLRGVQAAVLEHWAQALPLDSDLAPAALERWLAMAPFDRRAHERMLDLLAFRGRLREGDEHLAATARRYDADGQDWAPIGHAWRAAKMRHARGATGAPRVVAEAAPLQVQPPGGSAARRASLAVMPFVDRTAGATLRGGLADGLADDIITRLSKLRSMFVIARGTTFALAERRVGAEDAGRRLDVDYVASGSLRRDADARLSVTVQLTETRSAQVVWAEQFCGRLDDAFTVLDEIGNRIVACIANEIEVAERNRAILKPPSSLNAWEAYHRGLWHMVRFHREDNEQARHFFQTAVRLDPTFARSYAGLSFTYFQDAFLGWGEHDAAIERAHGAASEGLMADDRDPASHWALGRAIWLTGRQDECLGELQTAVDLSPNFALGHYTLGWIHAQSGDPEAAISELDHSRALSPFDPMLFAMLASRALALMRLGRHDEAADWALKAAGRPNAHVHIRAVAMICLALAGRTREAQHFAAALQRAQPGYGVADFLKAFKLARDAEALAQQAAKRIHA